MIYGFTLKNPDVGGYEIKNGLDGLRPWRIYSDKPAIGARIFVNSVDRLAAVEAPVGGWYCLGVVSLPKGEHVIDIQPVAEDARVMISDSDLSDVENLDRAWENRSGQRTFEQDRVDYTIQDIRALRRHGFVMHQLKDTQCMAAPSGLPYGGIGAGKLEIASTGQLTAFSGNNNQDSPIYRMPGSFFAVGLEGDEIRAARVLQTEIVDQELLPAAEVQSKTGYPFGEYRYNVNPLPLDITLKAFSPHVPGSADDSSLPVVYFDFTLKNRSVTDAKVSLCFSWESLINVGGSMTVTSNSSRVLPLCYHTWNASYVWSDRRANHAEARPQSIRFYADDDRGNPASFGEHIIWCSDENAAAYPDRSLEEDEYAFSRCLAQCFSQPFTPTPEGEFRAGALVSTKELKPGEETKVSFVLVWHMPHLPTASGRDAGVHYATKFENADAVLAYALKEKQRLFAESALASQAMEGSDLPEWFARRLLNDRFVADTATWFDAAGRFSVNEAPTGMSGCMGTIDQRAASQGFWCTFFPDLDEDELESFRLAQGEDGLCSHDIGFSEVNPRPTVSTLWPDLAAAYTYQIYRHWQRTGDDAFARKHYPHVKKAVEWANRFDDYDMGVPYICKGRGTTYDNQHWEGINAFIASVHMALMALAADMAKRLGDPDAENYARMAEKARDTRVKLLWDENRRCFRNAYVNKTGETDESCFIASLAGDWYLMSVGLPAMLPDDMMKDAARAILKYCYNPKGLTDQGGRPATPAFMQYPAAYYCAPAAYLGLDKEAWEAMRINDETILTPPSNHFIQGLTYWFDGGPRWALPYYMTAPATWNLLDAFSGLVCDLRDQTLSVDPHISGKIPVFTQDAWFYVEKADGFVRFDPIRSLKPCVFKKVVVNGNEHLFTPGFDPGQQTLSIRL